MPNLLEGYPILDYETAYFTVAILQMVFATNVCKNLVHALRFG